LCSDRRQCYESLLRGLGLTSVIIIDGLDYRVAAGSPTVFVRHWFHALYVPSVLDGNEGPVDAPAVLFPEKNTRIPLSFEYETGVCPENLWTFGEGKKSIIRAICENTVTKDLRDFT
jgi:hypothetical protein